MATNDIRETLTGRVFFFTVFSSCNLVVSNHFKNPFVIIYFRLLKLSLIWSTYQIILIRIQIRKCQISFTLCSGPYEEIWGAWQLRLLSIKFIKLILFFSHGVPLSFRVYIFKIYFIQTPKEVCAKWFNHLFNLIFLLKIGIHSFSFHFRYIIKAIQF